jgi:hypothetical protein
MLRGARTNALPGAALIINSGVGGIDLDRSIEIGNSAIVGSFIIIGQLQRNFGAAIESDTSQISKLLRGQGFPIRLMTRYGTGGRGFIAGHGVRLAESSIRKLR